MNGAQIRLIRTNLGLTQAQLGTVLGYSGDRARRGGQVYKLETGRREISPPIRRLMQMLERYGCPPELLNAE